jgi:hypothetical protein
MIKEFSKVRDSKSFTVAPLLPGKRAMTCKVILRTVRAPDALDGIKYKIRLAPRGCSQRFGEDFDQTS